MMKSPVRHLSWVIFLGLMGIDLAFGRSTPWRVNISCDLLVALSVLLVTPERRDRKRFFWTLLSGVMLVAVWLSVRGLKVMGAVCAMLGIFVLFTIWKTYVKYARVRSLFKREQVWEDIRDYTQLLGIVYGQVMGVLLLMSCFIPAMILTLLVYVIFFFDLGPRLMIGRKKRQRLQSLVRGSLKDDGVLEDHPREAEATSGMERLYAALQEYVVRSQAFLNPSLDLELCARELGTNKGYLSRTVNVCSGRNFPQYVNYYRILFAQKIIAEESRRKMCDVATASGFNSVVTFNLAFKMLTGVTPTEWKQDKQAEALMLSRSHPASLQVQEQ